MNCIIIEDEESSRNVIEEFISKTSTLNLVSSYPEAIEAINIINNGSEDIQLIFLDIELPEMTGIDFIKSLKNFPQIIIVSGKDKYALEAFEYDVTDYLLKPVTYARFYKGVMKAFDRYSKEKGYVFGSDDIYIKKDSSLYRIKYDDILWVEALENYVVVSTYSDKFTIHFTMKAIERKMPYNTFKRVHRSYVVNINKIHAIQDNAIIIELENETKVIPIGKSYKDKLMSDLNLMTK